MNLGAKEIVGLAEFTRDTGEDILAKFDKPHQNARDFLSQQIIDNESLTVEEKTALLFNIKKLTREFANNKEICKKAKQHFQNSNQADTLDQDWKSYFFDRAKNVSNEAFQEMWAKILACECNENGAVPRAVINALSLLDSKSAKAFTEFCSITFDFNDAGVVFWDDYSETSFYFQHGLTREFASLMESIGLLKFDPQWPQLSPVVPFVTQYGKQKVVFYDLEQSENLRSVPYDMSKMPIPTKLCLRSLASYTTVGQKLRALISPPPNQEFLEFFKKSCEEKKIGMQLLN